MKELKEMTKEELLDEIKEASDLFLNENVDDEDSELVELETTILKEKNKAERVGKRISKLLAEKEKLEADNKDNQALMEYVRIIDAIAKAEQETKTSQDKLYESLNSYPQDKVANVNLSSDVLKIVYKRSYYREDFDVVQFKKDYDPNSAMYQKYIGKKLIKGNVKITLKG